MLCGSVTNPQECLSFDLSELKMVSKSTTKESHSYGAMVVYKEMVTIAGGRGLAVGSETAEVEVCIPNGNNQTSNHLRYGTLFVNPAELETIDLVILVLVEITLTGVSRKLHGK